MRPPPGLSAIDVIESPRGTSFFISEEGTNFSKDDFVISSTGITQAPQGACSAVAEGVDISQFQVLSQLGKGASSTVKLAMYTPTGTMVALKAINLAESTSRSQLIKELRALCNPAGVQNPNLISFYNAFCDKGHVFLALEYMDGGSLEDIVKRCGPIPEVVLAHIAGQVISGLVHLHGERRQVHRDLKPANILMNLNGEAKISDFGVSRELDSTLAAARTFIGTATYMAPERVAAEAYSFAADIWSLGLIVFECALGRTPYPKMASLLQMLETILHTPVPIEALDTSAFSPEFIDFVSVCLTKNKDARPTAQQLMQHPLFQKPMMHPGIWIKTAFERSEAAFLAEENRQRALSAADM